MRRRVYRYRSPRVRRIIVLVFIGVAIGLGCGLSASHYVETMLAQLDARDTAKFAGAVLLLVTVGALAAWIPDRRAAMLSTRPGCRGGTSELMPDVW